MWREMTERALQLRDRTGADRYFEIKYEDFVADPLAQGKRIGEFLGKDVGRAMKRKLKKAYTSSVKVGSRSTDRGRIEEANALAGDLLARLGYL